MKRIGNLWNRITDIENIKLAHKIARKGKSFYKEVKLVNSEEDFFCNLIRDSLINKTFKTSEYEINERFDKKKMRTIYKLPYFPDRIVHHALLNIIEDIFNNCLIRDTFQSIKGRGTSDAAKRVKKLIRGSDPPKYALKIDIEKYYPSVNNEILKQKIRTKIKCKDTLWLLDEIIDSKPGLPIGNHPSQILGNFYLNSFDWGIKQEIKPKGYFRYCDDILILSDSKSELLNIKQLAEDNLSKLGLTVKKKFYIYNVEKQGIDFVGYTFKPNCTRVRKSIVRNMKTTCRSLAKTKDKSTNSLSSIMSYKGWIKRANGKKLWRKNTRKLRNIFPKQIKGSL